MGTSMSSALTECNPPLPKVIQADPEPNSPLDVVTAKLGFFGYTSDYGIWNRERPSSSSDQSKRIWLWIHHRSQERIGKKFNIVSLENFQRGNKPQGPGMVLYRALYVPPSSSYRPYSYYTKQRLTNSSYQPVRSELVNERILSCYRCEWKMYNLVEIVNGTGNRYQQYFQTAPQSDPSLLTTTQMEPTAEMLQSSNVVLEIFARGHTEVTKILRETYRKATGEDTRNIRRTPGAIVHTNAQGEVMMRTETEVDIDKKHIHQVEYRVTKSGVVLAEWRVFHSNNLTELDTPYFHFHANSGWFVRSTNHIHIKPLINTDSAIALLLAHLCVVYFSVEPIHHDIPDVPRLMDNAEIPAESAHIVGERPWVAHYDNNGQDPSSIIYPGTNRSQPVPPSQNISRPATGLPPIVVAANHMQPPPPPAPTSDPAPMPAPVVPSAPSAPSAPSVPSPPPAIHETYEYTASSQPLVYGTDFGSIPVATLVEAVEVVGAEIPETTATISLQTATLLK